MKCNVLFALSLVCLTSFRIINSEPSYWQQADMFSGTWRYQHGQEVFTLSLWRTTEGYKGHYKKTIVDAGGNQVSMVYNSDKALGTTTTNWPYVISSGDRGQNLLGGTINDNTVIHTPNAGGFISGRFTLQVLNPNCFTSPTNGCALQAQWIVKKDQGLHHPDEPDFSVPTNIVLTKE